MEKAIKRVRTIHPEMTHKAYLFLLWLISKKRLHGYEMIKLLEKEGIGSMGASRLYPMLNQMLKRGWIRQVETKIGKRKRKAYEITSDGSKTLQEGKKLFRGILGEFIREMLS
ncbi:MAG: PadR family transcriptional regulator [Candidatus Micrarchaeota archaeon]|nr:PadR family transcriptional regulator [Candidatus Micrarchaeota archaeon]